jgi:hypothetical protein
MIKLWIDGVQGVIKMGWTDECFNRLCYGKLAGWLWNAVEG